MFSKFSFIYGLCLVRDGAYYYRVSPKRFSNKLFKFTSNGDNGNYRGPRRRLFRALFLSGDEECNCFPNFASIRVYLGVAGGKVARLEDTLFAYSFLMRTCTTRQGHLIHTTGRRNNDEEKGFRFSRTTRTPFLFTRL